MSETKGCIILLISVFFLLFFFLLSVTFTTNRKLEAFMQAQEKLNETTWEQDQKQDKEIRLLIQDAEINRSLLLTKEFLKNQQ